MTLDSSRAHVDQGYRDYLKSLRGCGESRREVWGRGGECISSLHPLGCSGLTGRQHFWLLCPVQRSLRLRKRAGGRGDYVGTGGWLRHLPGDEPIQLPPVMDNRTLRKPMDGNLCPGRLRSALRARLQEMGPGWMTLAQGDLWRRRCVSGSCFLFRDLDCHEEHAHGAGLSGRETAVVS